jgi:murein L,D-transpeptidase YafK
MRDGEFAGHRMNLSFGRAAALGLTVTTGALLAGCDDSYLDTGPGRSERPISTATLAQMAKIDTTPSAPVLIRTYKKEAELEIWKMKSDGRYALLKTYPICRWSGQLGPKKVEGDMQVPEGFYTIEPGQMNPTSHYYLAFNVGYPNAYDRALGRTGGSVMVHGVCSSAGCFSMTDEQVADIYAIARDAFRGGQREIQLQSYPFRMTPENMAKYRLDPNVAFWKELKNGADHFEVAKTEPSVLICGKHYVFGATADGPVSATAPCPALHRDDETESLVAEKESKDDAKVASLVAQGAKAIRTVYADGGQNPVFAGYKDTSDPDALISGPQEIVLNGPAAQSAPAVVRVAGADAVRQKTAPASARAPAGETPEPVSVASIPAAQKSSLWGASTQNVKRWLHLGGPDPAVQATVTAYVPEQPIPTDAPLPPRRDDKRLHVSLKIPLPPGKPGEAASAPEAAPADAPVPAVAPAQ